ncbi:hypothetical protein niasHS_013868 [Heterodera schachtii]|uniref:B30.2/SPRY domain-containing protein n=1 Tax=Heterodera schachtii TaxID=97005 RepID=A0ABD2IUK3_HETSC
MRANYLISHVFVFNFAFWHAHRICDEANAVAQLCGCHEGSYAYDDNGKFLGGGALLDGTSGQQSTSAPGSTRDCASAIDGTPSLDVGDIIGCGVNRVGGRITYTLNGKRLGSVNISANASSSELFPSVSLYWPGDKIEANFGPVFKHPQRLL